MNFIFLVCLFLSSLRSLIDLTVTLSPKWRRRGWCWNGAFCSLSLLVSVSSLISVSLCTDIHGAERIKPNDFGNPLTFPLAPPCGWWSDCWAEPLINILVKNRACVTERYDRSCRPNVQIGCHVYDFTCRDLTVTCCLFTRPQDIGNTYRPRCSVCL